MRKLCLFLLVLSFISTQVFASVNFGSQRSAIKVAGGANLRVAQGLTVNEGSIVKRDSTANIYGNTITFTKGILQSSESEVVLTADYNTSGNDTIQLRGDNSFRAEPGNVLHDITVGGIRNRIEGQPTFENSPGITLNDSATTLTVAVQSKLNQNIALAGGTLYLGDDLSLADDVRLTGGGTIFLRGRQLEFGGKDSTWSENIFWDNANDMVFKQQAFCNRNLDICRRKSYCRKRKYFRFEWWWKIVD